MNGKKAKQLRRLAEKIVIQLGHKMSDGVNEYNQAMNRIDWEPQLDDNGHPMLDPEGFAMMKPARHPGTITTAWKFRAMYKNLKKVYKRGDRDIIRRAG